MIVSQIYKTLTPMYYIKVKVPHYLMELTDIDYNSLNNNIINLDRMKTQSGDVDVVNTTLTDIANCY